MASTHVTALTIELVQDGAVVAALTIDTDRPRRDPAHGTGQIDAVLAGSAHNGLRMLGRLNGGQQHHNLVTADAGLHIVGARAADRPVTL